MYVLLTYISNSCIYCHIYPLLVDFLKARCTPEKLTTLTKHSKTFFQPCCKEDC